MPRANRLSQVIVGELTLDEAIARIQEISIPVSPRQGRSNPARRCRTPLVFLTTGILSGGEGPVVFNI